MKKRNAAIVTVMIILMLFNSISFASSKSVKASPVISRLTEVKCQNQNNQVQISMALAAYQGYTVKEYKNPSRIVVDIPNTVFHKNQQSIEVKSNWVKSVRYAQNDKNLVRVVIDTVGQPQYFTEEKDGMLMLYVVQPLINGLNYYTEGNHSNLMLSGIQLIQSRNGRKTYTEKLEQGGKKYTLTFPSVSGKLESKLLKLNDGLFSSIQVIKNTKTKQTSIVLSAKSKLTYKVYSDAKLNRSGIEISKSAVADRGEENRQEEVREEVPQAIPSLSGVAISSNGNAEIIDILVDQYNNYNIMRLTEWDRIVVDIPNVMAPVEEQVVGVDSSLVKAVRYAQGENNTARVVIDTNGKPQYHVSEKTGKLSLTIETPNYRNISYHNTGDRVNFRLEGVKLTQGDAELTKFYTESYDETGLKFTITFPNSFADIGTGFMKIDDAIMDSVEMVQSDIAPTTSIIFTAKDHYFYNIISRTIPETITSITVLKPASVEDKLVVLDPGHGDFDPGAVVGDLKEKNLNLDIATRLSALLKSKNIKTYMMREDDTFVGLYERTHIANNLNAALFLSIHNNAYNSNFAGSETLYASGKPNEAGMSGAKFAQIIQNSMISNLGTKDLHTILRNDLVVVRETSMPAALAEIAFMTNKGDRARLVTEEFRQKAAEALCEGILKALAEN